jgi:hypothetical protein
VSTVIKRRRDYWIWQWRVLDPPGWARAALPAMRPGSSSSMSIRWSATFAGKTVGDQMLRHVYDSRDGLIRRMDIMKG